MNKLAIVMPIYNEEDNIAKVIRDWRSGLERLGIAGDFLLVNDGSKDGTARILDGLAEQMPELRIFHKPNSGHGRSCRYGYERAIEGGYDWVLQIDSDGQCDPSFLGSFWDRRNESDCIFGYREIRDDGLVRLLISRTCQVLTSLLAGVNLSDANVPYRLLRTGVLKKALEQIPADFDIHNVAVTFVLKKNKTLRWAHVPIRFLPRQGGINSINIQKIAKMGLGMLRDLRRLKAGLN